MALIPELCSAIREAIIFGSLHSLDPFVDLPSPGRLNFNRPGTCCWGPLDEQILNVLECTNHHFSTRHRTRLFNRLLQCSLFLDHDLGLVAHKLAQNLGPGATYLEPLQMDIVFQWLDSDSHKIQGYDGVDHFSKWLFRSSSSSMVEKTWGLLRRTIGKSLDGLQGLRVYHPLMTHTSMKWLVWSHPLLATHLIHIREQHFQCLYRLARTNMTSLLFSAQHMLMGLEREVKVVRCVGGIRMSLLFGTTRVPHQVLRIIVKFMV